MRLNEYLKRDRENKGMTQQEYADWLGVSKFTILNLELGYHKPSIRVKRVLKKKLKLSFEQLNEMTGE